MIEGLTMKNEKVGASGPTANLIDKFYKSALAEGVFPETGDSMSEMDCFLASIGGEVVGAVVLYSLDPAQSRYYVPGYWIQFVYVVPSHRRRGIGAEMLSTLGALADATGNKLMLGTGEKNEAMRWLATKAGFATDHVVMRRVPK